MGFTKAQLESYRDTTVADLLGPEVRLLFVGINPGLWTAATQTHFARPGNRFYPALLQAGIIDHAVDPSTGMTDADREYFRRRGIGISNLASRATARADELTPAELREGRRQLEELIARIRPRVVAVAGISAFRLAFQRPRVVAGEQPDRLHGARVWVVPNPSGLNAHDTVASLAAAYREPAIAAGLLPPDPSDPG